MTLDVIFDEQNTDFNIDFKDDGVHVHGVMIDNKISDTSENPVQNKVIAEYITGVVTDSKEYVDEQISKIEIPEIPEIDEVVTEGSTNLITSGAVYEALQGEPGGSSNSQMTHQSIINVVSEMTQQEFVPAPVYGDHGNPVIPNPARNYPISSVAMEEYVDEKLEGFEGGSGEPVDLSNYYTKEEVDNKGFLTAADIPEQLTKTSQLENDSNFVVASKVFDNTEQAQFKNVLDNVTLTAGKYLSGANADYNDYSNTNATSFEEYIPVKNNDIIRMKDVYLGKTSSVAKIATYNANYEFLNEFKSSTASNYYWDILETDEDENITSFKLKNRSSIAYMRFCFRTADIGENPVVTINEEISYEMGYGNKLNSNIKVDQSQILNAPQKNCWSILPNEHLNIAYSQIYGRKPMNTVEHFRDVAENFNFNVLKVDVEPTSDGELVCCHDKGFTFNSDGNITVYDPNNATLIYDKTAEECIGYTHPTGEHICLIGDFLSICRQYGKVAFITIRERYMETVIPKLLSELKKHNMMYSTIINSMTYDSLVKWRMYDTSVMTNYTLYAEQPITVETIDKALAVGYCSHCGLGFTASNNTPDTVCNFDYARERGVRLLQSIARNEGSVENCYALGYDGCQIAYEWNPKSSNT